MRYGADLPEEMEYIVDSCPIIPAKDPRSGQGKGAGWTESLKENLDLVLITPGRKHKGDTLISGDTFSAFVSSVRQPVECFFRCSMIFWRTD